MNKTEHPASLFPPDTISIDTLMRTKFFRPRVSSDVISRDSRLASSRIARACAATLWSDEYTSCDDEEKNKC